MRIFGAKKRGDLGYSHNDGSSEVQKWLKISVITNALLALLIFIVFGYFFLVPFFATLAWGEASAPYSDSAAYPPALPTVSFCADQRKDKSAAELSKLGPPLYDCNSAYITSGSNQTFWVMLTNQSGSELKNVKISIKIAQDWNLVESPDWQTDSGTIGRTITKLAVNEDVKLPVTFKAPNTVGVTTPGVFHIYSIDGKSLSENQQPQFVQPSVNVYVPNYKPQ